MFYNHTVVVRRTTYPLYFDDEREWRTSQCIFRAAGAGAVVCAFRDGPYPRRSRLACQSIASSDHPPRLSVLHGAIAAVATAVSSGSRPLRPFLTASPRASAPRGPKASRTDVSLPPRGGVRDILCE